MRRIAALWVGVAMMLAMTAGVGLAIGEYYLDDFSDGYLGSHGTVEWSGKWTEIGDDGNENSGKVTITSSGCSGSCLMVTWGAVALSDTGARRPVDLGFYSAATLSYQLDVDLPALPLTTAVLRVEALDGSIWRTLKTHAIATSEGTQTASASMNVVAGKSSAVRFVVSGILDGSVRIDDVRIDLTPVPPSTTTTTTSSTTTTTSSTTTTTSSTTSTTTATTTTLTLPPTTLPTIPTVTTTTLPGSIGPTISTTTTTQSDPSATTTTAPGGGSGGTAPTPGSEGEGGSTSDGSPDATSSAGSGGESERVVVAPIALDVVADEGSGQIEILDADYSADFSLAAEVFDLLGIGPLLLAGIISALALVGIDRRRTPTALTWRRPQDDS